MLNSEVFWFVVFVITVFVFAWLIHLPRGKD